MDPHLLDPHLTDPHLPDVLTLDSRLRDVASFGSVRRSSKPCYAAQYRVVSDRAVQYTMVSDRAVQYSVVYMDTILVLSPPSAHPACIP